MVGKPNLDAKPAATPLKSTGLRFTELDEEREASMADEGGAAGAEMEAEECNPEPLIAVPHFHASPRFSNSPSSAPTALPDEDPLADQRGKKLGADSEDTKDDLRNLILLTGLAALAGFFLLKRIRQRGRSRLRLVK